MIVSIFGSMITTKANFMTVSEEDNNEEELIINLTDNDTFLNLSLKVGKVLEPFLESSSGKSALAFLGGRFGFLQGFGVIDISMKDSDITFQQIPIQT